MHSTNEDLEVSQDQEKKALQCARPPDGGYGWVCVACLFLINGFTWGIVQSYGIFLSYYLSHSTFPGAKPTDFAFVGGLNFGAAMLSAPLITGLCRHTGIHPIMTIGTFVLSGAFLAASFATRTWHLYLTQGVMVGVGVGCIYIPSIAVLSQWFEQRRSLANGISTAGSGIGGLIFSFAAGAMLEHRNRHWALRVIGIAALVVNLLATVLIRDRNAVIRPKQHPFDKDLLSQPAVLWLLAWGFLVMLGYLTLLYSMSDFARCIGLTPKQAIVVTAVLNTGTAIGRPFIGVSSDRFGRFNVAAGLTLFCGLCCFAVWVPATSYGVSLLFAIISGAIMGVFMVTIGPLCVEVAGLKELPSLMALAWLTIVLPTTFGEVVALHLRRPGHDREYLYTQCFVGTCYVCASICLWMVRSKVGKDSRR